MYGTSEHTERRFLHRLAERRMRVHRGGDVFGRPSVLECKHRLLNQLRHIRPDHVTAEQLVSIGVSDELDEAGGVARGARAAVGAEWELARLVLSSARLHLVLGQTYG